MVAVDGGDNVPAYCTQKIVGPVKHIVETDASGDRILVTVVTTCYFDAEGNHIDGQDKRERFEDGEHAADSPNDMMDTADTP
jgi:hypothetical protein